MLYYPDEKNGGVLTGFFRHEAETPKLANAKVAEHFTVVCQDLHRGSNFRAGSPLQIAVSPPHLQSNGLWEVWYTIGRARLSDTQVGEHFGGELVGETLFTNTPFVVVRYLGMEFIAEHGMWRRTK